MYKLYSYEEVIVIYEPGGFVENAQVTSVVVLLKTYKLPAW